MGKPSPAAEWDRILQADLQRSRQDYALMAAAVAERELSYGGRFVPCVLKPDIISHKNARDFAVSGRHILSALEKVIVHVLEQEDHPWWDTVDEKMRRLLRLPNPLPRHMQIARLDGCLAAGQAPRYLENNADSPAGFAYATVLQDALLETDTAQLFGKRFKIKRGDYVRDLCDFLLKLYADARGGDRPNVAIADWRDARTASEFHIVAAELRKRGCLATVCDPRDMRMQRGKLYTDGRRVDLVYRRAIVHELAQREHQCDAFLRAAESGAALFVNPFSSAIGSCKQLLARMRMGEFRSLFTESERQALRKHLPYSYMLNSDTFTLGGKRHDTLQFTIDRQEEIVIKPIRSYGGDDIHFGRAVSARQWRNLVEALRGDPYVCQEWVDIPTVQVPAFSPQLTFRAMKMITNPFFLGGDYIGCLTRLALGKVVNVGAGGMPQANITLG